MDGSHRGFRGRNDFDLTVQGLAQTVPTEGVLNSEHGNQEYDNQDHKKNPHHHENSTAKARIIGNRNRDPAVRALFQLMIKLLFALRTLNRFHIKRLTRLICSGQVDFLQTYLTPINTDGAGSTPPGRHAPYYEPGPGETGIARIECLALQSRQ